MKNELTGAIAQQHKEGAIDNINTEQLNPASEKSETPAINTFESRTERSVHAGFRFINFAIDLFVWFVMALISVVLLDHFLPTVDHFTINALAYSAMAGLFLGYYFILEYFFQKTLGKLLIGTKVTDLNGEKPTARAIAFRTLSRLIPIDLLSYFFSSNGMHDALSKTRVVKSRKR